MLAEMRKQPGGSVLDVAMFTSVQTRGLAPVRLELGPTFRVRSTRKMLAEMRKQPGGSEQDVAMQRTKDGELRVVGCWLRVEG